MNNKKYNKLKPYLSTTSSKSRVIIYLIVNGSLIDDVINLTVRDLLDISKEKTTPPEIVEAISSLVDREKIAPGLAYPSGRKYNQFDIIRILKNAHKRAKKKFTTLENFRNNLKNC